MVDISVIIPIYNVEAKVERCLKSLFRQTKTEGVEFLLINDATPDNSMDVVRRVVTQYPTLNIRILENESNMGISATRGRGVKEATGEYSIHIDSDDWCELTMLEDLWAKRLECNADIIVCDYIEDRKGMSIYKFHRRLPEVGSLCISNVLEVNYEVSLAAMWVKLVRHELYSRPGLEFAKGINMMEDVLISIKLFHYADSVVHFRRAFYHYDRCNDLSLFNNYYGDARAAAISAMSEIDLFIRDNVEITEYIQQALLKRKFNMYQRFLIDSDGEEQQQIAQLYPEISGFIRSLKTLKLKRKIALLVARHNMLGLTNFIYRNPRRRSVKAREVIANSLSR